MHAFLYDPGIPTSFAEKQAVEKSESEMTSLPSAAPLTDIVDVKSSRLYWLP